jgi:hypothetical protein
MVASSSHNGNPSSHDCKHYKQTQKFWTTTQIMSNFLQNPKTSQYDIIQYCNLVSTDKRIYPKHIKIVRYLQ